MAAVTEGRNSTVSIDRRLQTDPCCHLASPCLPQTIEERIGRLRERRHGRIVGIGQHALFRVVLSPTLAESVGDTRASPSRA